MLVRVQINDGGTRLTLRTAFRQMSAEGAPPGLPSGRLFPLASSSVIATCTSAEPSAEQSLGHPATCLGKDCDNLPIPVAGDGAPIVELQAQCARFPRATAQTWSRSCRCRRWRSIPFKSKVEITHVCYPRTGTVRAFFKGNGANVVKIAPETALKLTFNDRFKALLCEDPHDITPAERMAAGALAGASAQVR